MEFADEDWAWQFDMSVRHVFLATQIVGPLIGKSGGGTMVYVSSTSAVSVSADRAAYGASKAALQQFVKASAIEFGDMGVRINAVAPGLVATPRVKGNLSEDSCAKAATRYPLGAIGEPSQIASVILFLASELSAHVNGQTVFAEGGVLARSPLHSATTTAAKVTGGLS